MALVIEDGTQVAGANSYATVAQLVSYAQALGITIPSDNAERETLLLKAAAYIALFEGRFTGKRVSSTQPLAWPRCGAVVNGFKLLTTQIPQALIDAQVVIAARGKDLDLLPTQLPSEKGEVTSEKVGPVAITYAALSRGGVSYLDRLPQFPEAVGLLRSLMSTKPLFTYKA